MKLPEPDAVNLGTGLGFELAHNGRFVYCTGLRMGFCPYKLPLADSVIAEKQRLCAAQAAEMSNTVYTS